MTMLTTSLPGNPFEAEQRGGTGAITDAVLALAFEQRTANLLAFLHQAPYGGGRADLIDTIRTRLGLNDERATE